MTRNGYLGRQTSLQTSSFLFLPPPFIVEHNVLQSETPLWCIPSLLACRVVCEAEKALAMHKHCTARTKTLLLLSRLFVAQVRNINTIQNTRPIAAAMKKILSVKTSTMRKSNAYLRYICLGFKS